MNEKKKLNRLVIAIIAFFIITNLPIFPFDDSRIEGYILSVVFLLFIGIVHIVLGFIAKKQIKKSQEKGKIISILSIILGFVFVGMSLANLIVAISMVSVEFNDEVYCQDLKNCIDNNDGTSYCQFDDMEFSIKCSTDRLTDEQFKK